MMIRRSRAFIAISLALIVGIIAPNTLPITASAGTVSPSEWQAGKIIDDSIFTDSSSMTVDQIQSFLNNLVPNCDTYGTQPASDWGRSDLTHAQFATQVKGWPGPPYVCLRNYYEVPKTAPGPGMPDNSYNHNGNAPAGSISAAQMIYNAAQQYHISPKVLLIKIRSESSGPLTTDSWPLQSQYTYAMGAHCPDSGPGNTPNCDPNYAGFSIQISEAAALLRYYLDNMTQSWWPYKKLGNNSIQYNPTVSCGSSVVNITTSATAALYTYTPYQPNAAALAAGYGTAPCGAYGNRNFWLYYNDWFGSTILPSAFKSPNSATVYIGIGGYKLAVPYMGMLQDYGISPQSIQTLSQATIDSIPSPTSSDAVSSNLSYIIKSTSDTDADGGSIYLVSINKKYQFTSMQQFNDFGFNTANISYLPLSFIQSIPGSSALSNFVTSPYGSVFDISGGQKRLILDNTSYKSLNPSDSVSRLSYFTTDLIPSGAPIASRDYLIRSASNPLVYLYLNGSYYSIPTSDAYRCWGFGTTQSTPLYILPQDNYASNITPADSLSCVTSDGTTTSLLNTVNRLAVPVGDNIAGKTYTDSGVASIASKLPLYSSPLKQYVKGVSSSAVWYITTNGTRQVIPTYNDYQLLDLTSSDYNVIDDSALSAIPVDGGVRLGTGSLVKSNSSATVYVINGTSRLAYPTSNLFNAYNNSWNDVQTYSTSILDTEYPTSQSAIQNYFYDQPSNSYYLVDPNGCYSLTNQMITAYGQSTQSIASAQTYTKDMFPGLKLQSCKSGSYFAKQPGDSLVYWIDSGTKYPINTWAKLVDKAQSSNPYVITINSSILNSFTTGSPL